MVGSSREERLLFLRPIWFRGGTYAKGRDRCVFRFQMRDGRRRVDVVYSFRADGGMVAIELQHSEKEADEFVHDGEYESLISSLLYVNFTGKSAKKSLCPRILKASGDRSREKAIPMGPNRLPPISISTSWT